MLSQATLDAIQYISKLVNRGLTPKQAADKLLSDTTYRCSKGYVATKGAVSKARKTVERRLEMEEAMKNGVTIFINGKPQQ